MGKIEELQALENEIAADADLPLRPANLVFGEGNIDCTVLFIGEAPGQKEDELKRPFVGRAGQLLNKLIEQVGWRRKDVYITNIVKRRPPENRDPSPEEIEAYKPYLSRQIEIIRPKIIATLGRFSMNYFLPEARIMRDQGKVFRIKNFPLLPEEGFPPKADPPSAEGEVGAARGTQYFVVPLLHPAAALRSTEMADALEASFKKLPSIIKACEKYEEEPRKASPRGEPQSLPGEPPGKIQPPKQAGLF